MACFSFQNAEHGGATRKPGVGGASAPTAAAAASAAWADALAGASSAPPTWVGRMRTSVSPVTPSMLLIRFAGTAGSEVLTRRCLPLASTVTSEVWNVFSTCAALPSASMKARLAGTPVIFRPWDASHDDTLSTEAWVGEKRARYWSGVRYWRYSALPGVDTARASASAPAWSRRRSCTWKRTRVLRATAGLLAANRAEGRVLPLKPHHRRRGAG